MPSTQRPYSPRFSLGQTVLTAGVHHAASKSDTFATFVNTCLNEHANGRWGHLSDEDRIENDRALVDGERLLSAYPFECAIEGPWGPSPAARCGSSPSATARPLPSSFQASTER